MLVLSAILLFSALLSGCSDATQTESSTAPQSSSQENTSASDYKEETDDVRFDFSAPDGSTVNLADEEYYTVSLPYAYGYENLGEFGENMPEASSLNKTFTKYQTGDKLGEGLEITYAQSIFSFIKGEIQEHISQSVSANGNVTLKGIITKNDSGATVFYPYPDSLKAGGIPCFYNRDSYNPYGDILLITKPDGTESYMNTMPFELYTYDDSVALPDATTAKEITITTDNLNFNTDGTSGHTKCSASVIKAE